MLCCVVRGDNGGSGGISEGDNICKMVWQLRTGDSISINIVM